jgi:hypothetical protein
VLVEERDFLQLNLCEDIVDCVFVGDSEILVRHY